MPPEGPCHICGRIGPLSFEHVPPRAAFNNTRVLVIRGESVIHADLDNPQGGRYSQRGAGAYTLCPRCNSDTGGWYGGAYVDWAYQAAGILQASLGRPSLYFNYHIFPLRVIKQIFSMFFSSNTPTFAATHPELVRFVLDRSASGLHPRYRVLAYLNATARTRFVGVSGTIDTHTGTIRVMSEIAFPPFGFVLLLSGPSPDARLVDISFMTRFHYNDWKHVSLRLSSLSLYTGYPGDYRDRERVHEEARRNEPDDDERRED